MKSRRTRKRNSRRKIRMSRKHQGGDETLTNKPETEPIIDPIIPTTAESTITESITDLPVTNSPVQNELTIIKNAMYAESEKMIKETSLDDVIAKLEELVNINLKDNSANKIKTIAGKTGEDAKNFTEDIINIQKELLAELKKRQINRNSSKNKKNNTTI